MDFSAEVVSVKKWLDELQSSTETECMCVLQGKSLEQSMPSYYAFTKSIKDGIDTVRNDSHFISKEFSKLFSCTESGEWKNFKIYTFNVTYHIRNLIQECNIYISDPPHYILEQQDLVLGECAKLAQQIDSLLHDCDSSIRKTPLINHLTYLGQSFGRLVDLMLGYLVQRLVDMLDRAEHYLAVTSAVNTMVSLGLEGEHMCYLIAREGGVRSLIEMCRSDSAVFVHTHCLRALATICCVEESILELEREGGVECLTDMLCDSSIKEKVRGEAAGVIAQITSPSLDHFQLIGGFIENMEDLIKALIGLCQNTVCHEIFLLSSAAVANITFMDSLACECLLQVNAARVLIQSCSSKKAGSLYAKDQIVTILANMAVTDDCRTEITGHNGIDLLIKILNERPTSYKSKAEKSACERVQQKAAIALTRLCRDQDNAQTIIDLQGIPRLITLCRGINERNGSDAVLIACLAALRKINSICDLEELTPVDFQQLIQPKLMDSFLICSHSDENFV